MQISNLFRTIAGYGVLAGLLLLPLVAVGQASSVGVQSADLQAQLTTEGTLQVEETIQYNFGNQQLSGFTRRLWVPDGGSVGVDSVRRGDLSEDFNSTRAGNVRRITTGSSDIPLTGEHTYQFTYTVDGAVTSTGSGPQISWQAISESGVDADDITITLTAPFEITQAACRLQETDRGCPVTRVDEGVQAQLNELPANRSVVLRADLPSSALALPANGEQEGGSATLYAILVVGLLILAASSYGMYRHVANKPTADKKEEPVPDHIDTLSS